MEKNLIKFDGEQRMSSLEIAEITGKDHAHVMRDIRNMEPAWEKISQSKFGLTSYKDAQGKERPCYILTKTECLYIATKYSDEIRAKLILRWEALETGNATPAVQPKTQAELLLIYAQQMVEQERRVLAVETKNSEIEDRLDQLESRTSTSIDYTTVVGFARRYGIDMPNKTAQYIGKAASRQCRAKGRTIGDVCDTRYGSVHSYPNDILEEIFKTLYPNKF